MSNAAKWTGWEEPRIPLAQRGATAGDPAAGRRYETARWRVAGAAAALAALIAVVPAPTSWASLLIRSRRADAAGGAIDRALLLVAGVSVWALVAWCAAVGTAAIASHLPGLPGLCGRLILTRIAPAATVRIVAAAVGVGVLAGTSACTVPDLVTAGGSDPSVSVSTDATSTTGTQSPSPQTPATDPSAGASTSPSTGAAPTITIDWPAPDESPPAAGNPTTTTPAPGPTAAAPENTPTVAPTSSATPASAQRTPTPAPQLPPQPVAATGAAPAATGSVTGSVTGNVTGIVTGSVTDPTAAGTVTVLPGDSLWSIARHHLTRDATAIEIDSSWHAWYSANRALIGSDPNLIETGQHLVPPTDWSDN